MQNSYIAIDGGTTNTRLTLVSGPTVQGTAKYAVGVSDAVRDRAVLGRARSATESASCCGRPASPRLRFGVFWLPV